MEEISRLTTEEFNEKSSRLDEMSIEEILNLMNEEDSKIPVAVQKVLSQVEKVVTEVVKAIKNGGRLIYIGAGTSGRIGVLDAVECPPTFSTPFSLVRGILAGGESAMFKAVEGAEDKEELGEEDLKNIYLTAHDIVIGIAASGRTPYVKGALQYANSIGAVTASLTSNPNSALSQIAQIPIEVVTGPEVLTGSTRLKAATAHKMIANMITTTSMVKLGKVYKNLMVDVHASNYKLRERAKKIVMTATGASYEKSSEVLEQTEFDVKLAVLRILANISKEKAQELIVEGEGFVVTALNLVEKES